ncbi:hypothetical protein HYC85_014520 [Camellia sinensis]|uniref:Amino acid transporter transmembrane domain-containing protein n=1 Tax=Camellia sinensis TaxID=4442 RepID=A0A7J7H6E7_CAMSI|nr:hypothetical protein HYC85_014520 [Camellia sinensis]
MISSLKRFCNALYCDPPFAVAKSRLPSLKVFETALGIPDFHNMAWLSIIAAIMSFSYSSIGDGKIKWDIYGVSKTTVVEKVWVVAQAIGDKVLITFEMKDTLKSPPPENQTMKKASAVAILLTTTLYLCCARFGYAALPGNLLIGFGFYEPH